MTTGRVLGQIGLLGAMTAVLLAGHGETALAASFVNGKGTQTGTGDGSRLGVQDRIVICPYGDPANTGAAMFSLNGQSVENCHSVSNASISKEYFIPWNTAPEWDAFVHSQQDHYADFLAGSQPKPDMTIGQVCPLQGQITICKGSALEQTIDASTFNQREVGVKETYNHPPLGHYAAEGDIYTIALTGSDLLTLTCLPDPSGAKHGSWIATTAPDSCTETPAQCAHTNNTWLNKPFVNSDPQPLENTDLCVKGNKTSPAEFSYTSPTSWGWTCHGANNTSVQCSAGYQVQPIDGNCGWFNNRPASTNLADDFNTNGGYDKFRQFCDSGLVKNFVSHTGGSWSWQCAGVQGGNDSAICQSAMQTENGACGYAAGTKVPTPPNVQSGNLCLSGFASPTTADYDSASGLYTWKCLGNVAGQTTSEQCGAAHCNVCGGTDPAAVTFFVKSDVMVKVSGGATCAAHATATWDSQGSGRGGNLSSTIHYDENYRFDLQYSNKTDDNLCPPCYIQSQNVHHLAVTLEATPGTCPQDAALNSGKPVNLKDQ